MADPQRVSRLQGRRILVVEDEFLLAEDLRYDLEQAGAEVVGPVGTVTAALQLIKAESGIDGAILDVNLGSEKVFPVADALRERGVPFVFSTGYDRWALPEGYAEIPRYEKPADIRKVAGALLR